MELSQKMLNQFFLSSKQGLVLNSMDGSFVEFNDALLEMIGYTRDELIDMSYWDLIPKEYTEKKLQQIDSLIKNGSYGPSEKVYYHKMGYRISVQVYSTIVTNDDNENFIFSTIEDITDSKKAQDVLNKAQALGNIGHWYLDLLSNKLEWSDETYRIFGLQPQEFDATYEAFVERIYIDDRDDVNNAYNNSIEVDEPYQIEHRVIRPDGEIRYVIERCEHYHSKDGEIIGSIGTVLDITERKMNENRLIEAKTSAEAANILKSSFIANISHELRTPLNAILGFSNKMALDDSLNEKNRKHLDIINSSGEHLLNIINDILDMSKIEAGEMKVDNKPFDLIESIQAASELMSFQVDSKKIECALNVEKNVPQYIISDEGKIKQVLLNIIGNAIKFTEYGSIKLSISSKLIDKEANRMLININISDTGCGIEESMINKVFEPFIQNDGVKKVEGGSGLGLAISKNLMKLLGGTIKVQSKLGEGSEFQVSFPVEVAGEMAIAELSKKIKDNIKDNNIVEDLEIDELPSDTVSLILDSARRGSGLSIKKELEKIKTTHTNTYRHLSELINQHDFDAIVELLEESYE